MDTKAFDNPNGKFVNSSGHSAFVPKLLPPAIVYNNELTALIADAHRNLGQLAGIGQLLPNPHILINPWLRREAVLSSKIEGTRASLSDLFLYEAIKDESIDSPFKRIHEVRNYVHSLERSLNEIRQGRQIDLSLIKDAHKTLLYRVRGEDRNPGEFRTIQNWMGVVGQPLEDAIYVPPPPAYLNDLLGDLEHFVSSPPSDMPVLVQCAVLHYQFEVIHPFVDGNGRIGRLLMPLFLCEKKIMSQPLLYVSAYLEKNRTEYYARLLSVSQKSDWKNWIRFFLTAVSSQSVEAIDNVQKLLRLRDHWDEILRKQGATRNAHILMEILFSNPFTTAKNAAEYLDVSFVTAQSTIKALTTCGILEQAYKRKRNRVYVAKQIINILK